MIRPIETGMSLYSVDHKAHQAQNDPNAHLAQAAQQGEIVKNTIQQLQTVQKSPESEAEVKIRDKNSERGRGGQKHKRGKGDAREDAPGAAENGGASGGRLDFLA
jgi:dsRNA-specific ribonuclease